VTRWPNGLWRGLRGRNAESANEALTRVAEQTFDVALLDIKMRGTDGIELQRRLHEIAPTCWSSS